MNCLAVYCLSMYCRRPHEKKKHCLKYKDDLYDRRNPEFEPSGVTTRETEPRKKTHFDAVLSCVH